MRHPLHPSFRIPRTFTALIDFVMEGIDPADPDIWRYGNFERGMDIYCGDLDTVLLGEPWDTREAAWRYLAYHHEPLEIIPFCHNGGDALHYGWVVLAPELGADDHPCVSFAPLDDWAVWLGDDTKQALENLLVGQLADWRMGSADRPCPSEDERWKAVCRALDLRPDVESTLVGPGARTDIALIPEVPEDWRYEPTADGIGVLADATAFSPATFTIGPREYVRVEEYLPIARDFLAEGYPASALCVLKSLGGYNREIVTLMRDAYRQLGRDLHTERAEIWLRLHPDEDVNGFPGAAP